VTRIILSLAFRNGYKMCIRAYLNGDGSGYKTHLSLFFVVMKGEYDALLKWPFDNKVSMILVGKENEGLMFMFCIQYDMSPPGAGLMPRLFSPLMLFPPPVYVVSENA